MGCVCRCAPTPCPNKGRSCSRRGYLSVLAGCGPGSLRPSPGKQPDLADQTWLETGHDLGDIFRKLQCQVG